MYVYLAKLKGLCCNLDFLYRKKLNNLKKSLYLHNYY